MLRVRDIMTPDVVAVSTDRTLAFASWSMANARVRAIPVRDDGGAVIGMLTATDLADPTRRRRAEEMTVAEVMTPTVFTIEMDESAIAAAELMRQREIHQLVVVDASGRMAGIVSTMDILRALTERRDFYGEPDGTSVREPEAVQDERIRAAGAYQGA